MRARTLVLSTLLIAVAPACDAAAPPESSVRVERQDLLIEVDVSGTLKATDSDSITPPTIGDFWEFKIAMMAPEGAEVKKGEPILGFDPTELRRRLERKQAERDTAETQVETSRAQARVARFDDDLAMADAKAQHRKGKSLSRHRSHLICRPSAAGWPPLRTYSCPSPSTRGTNRTGRSSS